MSWGQAPGQAGPVRICPPQGPSTPPTSKTHPAPCAENALSREGPGGTFKHEFSHTWNSLGLFPCRAVSRNPSTSVLGFSRFFTSIPQALSGDTAIAPGLCLGGLLGDGGPEGSHSAAHAGATLERKRACACRREGVSVGEREHSSIPKCLQQPRLGAQPGAPTWVAGTRGLSPHLLPPRLQIRRRLESESELRPEPAEVRGGTWVSQQPPSCSAKLLPQHLDSICKLCDEQIPDS